jgi:hypothetical protein
VASTLSIATAELREKAQVMSWDVVLMKVPSNIVTVEDFPDDFSSELGPRSQVLLTLATVLPELDLTDPTWGILDGDDFSIQFNIGDDDPVDTIMLHVRGGDSAIGAIQRVCERTGWRALDMSGSGFINFAEDPAAGLRQWRIFRDRTVASLKAEGKEVITDVKVGRARVDAVVVTKPEKKRKWWQFWK